MTWVGIWIWRPVQLTGREIQQKVHWSISSGTLKKTWILLFVRVWCILDLEVLYFFLAVNLCHLLNLAVPVKSVTTPSPSAGCQPQPTAYGAVPASAPPFTSDELRWTIATIQTSLPDFCLKRSRMCSHRPAARWEQQSSARRQLQTARKLYVKNVIFLYPHWNNHTGKANVAILIQKCHSCAAQPHPAPS